MRQTRKARNGAPIVMARHVIGEFKVADNAYHEVHVFTNLYGGEVTLRSTAKPYLSQPDPMTATFDFGRWDQLHSNKQINDFIDGIVATLRKGEVPKNMRFVPTKFGVLV